MHTPSIGSAIGRTFSSGWRAVLLGLIGLGLSSGSLALTVTVTGAGQVVSIPAGISCGNGATTCTAGFAAGTNVLLGAVAASGNGLTSWGGICSGRDVKCAVSNTAGAVTATFAAPSGNMAAVSAGGSHTCAITAGGALECWGRNTSGQVGNDATTPSNFPVPVSGLASGVVAVASGGAHTCALTSTGAVKCWGINSEGELGNNTNNNASTPVAVVGLSTGVVALASGVAHSCALTSAGAVQCWGYNGHGELGNNGPGISAIPVPVSGLSSGVVAITARNFHTCALTSAGAALCWGWNAYGQLGNGTTITAPTPVPVSTLSTGVLGISAGAFHTCARTATTARCWGRNSVSQLGNNGFLDSLVPVVASQFPAGPAAIVAGDDYTCALSGTGGVTCLGSNFSGELGNNSTTISTTPVAATGLGTGVVALERDCALTAAGAVLCWGYNGEGRVGNNTTANALVPTTSWTSNVSVNVGGSATVTSVPGGINCTNNTCAALYAAGSSVTLTAAPSAGTVFTGWSGGGCSGTGTCTTTVNGAVAVSATFASALTVTKTGNGTVTSLPAGINCGLTCTTNIAVATSATLFAAPSAGSVFTGWGGACSGTNTLTCITFVYAPSTVIANFSTTPPLTVITSGSGTVVSSPVGINCGASANCTSSFSFGSTVTLTATPSAGNVFKGWSGYCINTTPTCTVTMNAVNSVTATFGSPTLTVNLQGRGSVSSNPAGISGCGSGCSASFATGTAVVLTATPDTGEVFTGWFGGGCTGKGTCTVIVNADMPVWANFTQANSVWTLASGDAHTCAVTAGGAVQCWGANGTGQLGNNSIVKSAVPVPVNGLASGFVSVAAGASHSCALNSAGAVSCWGRNLSGQLGNNSTVQSNVPVAVSGLASGALAISADGDHTCALISGGTVRCWGANASGELGNNSLVQSNVPVTVSGLTGIVAITTGYNHSCALTSTGAVSCWGNNAAGQLGNNSLVTSLVPVAVNGLASGVKSITAGFRHSCAQTSAGGLKCWGLNAAGELGNNTTTNASVPVDVNGLATGVAAVAAGYEHNCALATDGTALCWGANAFGQLGDGGATNLSVPVPVNGLTSALAVVAPGRQHTCALTPTGAVLCWGDNSLGALGNNGTANSPLPVAVTGLDSTTQQGLPSVQIFINGAGSVTPSPVGVSCGTNCYAFPLNTAITLTSTALPGSTFTWGGACSGSGTCVLTVAGPTVVTATFVQPILSVVVVGTGTVGGEGSPFGPYCPDTSSPCNLSLDAGSTVTIVPDLTTGTFTGWSGACSGTGACTLVMNGNKSVTATFAAVSSAVSPLNVNVNGSEGGFVVSSPAGINCDLVALYDSLCTQQFATGVAVTLTAVTRPGYQFDGWTESCTGTNVNCTLASPNGKSVTANFSSATGLAVVVSGSGAVTSAPAGINCTAGAPTGCAQLSLATTVTLTAVASGGATFAGWSGGPCSGTAPTCVLPANFAGLVKATFGTVCLLPSVSGAGTIDSNFGPLPVCDKTGQSVNLHAEPAVGSVATGWGGLCAGQLGYLCIVSWPATTQSVSATFAVGYSAAVLKVGHGNGTVTSSAGGINCGATCTTVSLASGVAVTMTPAPTAGSVFRGWEGACSGTGACTLDMTESPLEVSADFFAPLLTVTTSVGGTVVSTPAGINCVGSSSASGSGVCSLTFANATAISLVATPLSGFTFASWGGACAGQLTTTCALPAMMTDTVVTANFTANSPASTNTLTLNNFGSGVVTSSPNGISCDVLTCSAAFVAGTSVTLTAAPGTGYAFGGWSGACSGTGSCVVAMSVARSVNATFSPTITVVSSGQGTVTSLPAGINCGTTCTAAMSFGASVTLTATPALGQVFEGWFSAGCSGTGTCTVIATNPATVVARFVVAGTGGGGTGGNVKVPMPAWSLVLFAIMLMGAMWRHGGPSRRRRA